jgi:hypothetical protein
MTMNLKLTPPKEITFWIAVALAVFALFSFLGTFTLLPIAAFWLLFIAFVLLALGVLIKNF